MAFSVVAQGSSPCTILSIADTYLFKVIYLQHAWKATGTRWSSEGLRTCTPTLIDPSDVRLIDTWRFVQSYLFAVDYSVLKFEMSASLVTMRTSRTGQAASIPPLVIYALDNEH